MSEQELAEKTELRGRSDHTITTNEEEVTLFVDLDDPKTKASTESKHGLQLVRVCIVYQGHRLHAFLNLEEFALTLEVNKPKRANVEIGYVMPRDGYPLGAKLREAENV